MEQRGKLQIQSSKRAQNKSGSLKSYNEQFITK